MNLSAVTFCFEDHQSSPGASNLDCLKRGLYKKELFSKWTIITCETHSAVIEFCENNDLECKVLSAEEYLLSTGCLLNQFIKQLDKDTWLVFLGVDVELPKSFNALCETSLSDTTSLYTATRVQSSLISRNDIIEFYQELKEIDGSFHLKHLQPGINKYVGNFVKIAGHKKPAIDHLHIWHLSNNWEYPQEDAEFLNFSAGKEVTVLPGEVQYTRPIVYEHKLGANVEVKVKVWSRMSWEQRVRLMKRDPKKILRKITNSKNLGDKWTRLSKKNKLRYIAQNPEKILKRLKRW